MFRDKYVTRTEYDELKSRFEQLEAFVQQRLGMGLVAAPAMPIYYSDDTAPAIGSSGAGQGSFSMFPPPSPSIASPAAPGRRSGSGSGSGMGLRA